MKKFEPLAKPSLPPQVEEDGEKKDLGLIGLRQFDKGERLWLLGLMTITVLVVIIKLLFL